MNAFRTILLLAGLPLVGQQYTISTLAGNGVAGAFLSNPTSVAVDPKGDVYVGDWSGFIRKIWVKDGATTVVAGTGVLGYGGDGGQATNARLSRSISLALDSAGNIYFTDGNNNRIRRIDASTRIITTVAGTGSSVDGGDGGPGVEAGVPLPTGITVDAAGDLYFSSSWYRVRKLTATTGTIQTIAGGLSLVSVATTDQPSMPYSGIRFLPSSTAAAISTLPTTKTHACAWWRRVREL